LIKGQKEMVERMHNTVTKTLISDKMAKSKSNLKLRDPTEKDNMHLTISPRTYSVGY
jgi:hypothetical protein